MSGKILDTAVPELNYRRNIIGDSLTPDLVQELQGYGALEWSPRDIAISMGFDIDQFTAEYKDPDSTVSLIITRGRLQAQADISKKVFENAKLGDLPSILHLEKIRREKSFQTSKLDIFGGFDDQKSFEKVSEYIAAGRTAELSNNEKLFIDLLSIINSLDRQFGKRATIKLLTQQFGYSYDGPWITTTKPTNCSTPTGTRPRRPCGISMPKCSTTSPTQLSQPRRPPRTTRQSAR